MFFIDIEMATKMLSMLPARARVFNTTLIEMMQICGCDVPIGQMTIQSLYSYDVASRATRPMSDDVFAPDDCPTRSVVAWTRAFEGIWSLQEFLSIATR
jgi:hypothetical protein